MTLTALASAGWALCCEQPIRVSLLLTLVLCSVVYCALLIHTCKHSGDERHIPAPPGLPVIGNLLQMLRPDYIQQVLAWCNAIGPVFKIR